MTDFVRITRGKRVALVHPDYADAIAAALLDREGCEPAGMTGRSAMQRFTFDGRRGLIRQYQRGGAIGPVLGDAYVAVNRPLKELTIHRQVYERGLSVPMPLGASWEKSGLLYRGQFATEQVGARNLYEFLSDASDDAETTLERCGALVRQMHELGVYHADLQLRNILVSEESVWLVDFDNATLHSHLGTVARARNLFRFRRSISKAGFPDALFDAFCRGYGDARLPGWLSGAYRAKGALSDVLSGRGRSS